MHCKKENMPKGDYHWVDDKKTEKRQTYIYIYIYIGLEFD